MGASKVVEQKQSLSPGSCDADKLAFSKARPVDLSVDTKADLQQKVVNKSDFQTSPKQSSDYPRQGSRLSKIKATTSQHCVGKDMIWFSFHFMSLKLTDRNLKT